MIMKKLNILFFLIENLAYPIVMGFEPYVNQRLLPPTFPRFIRIHSFEVSIKTFNEILNQVTSTLKIFEFETFQSLFDFCLKFSNNNQSVFLRSLLQVKLII
jgi:hypothetical protein